MFRGAVFSGHGVLEKLINMFTFAATARPMAPYRCQSRLQFSLAQVPAGRLLQYRCIVELPVPEYTHQWQLPMHTDNSTVAASVQCI